ncbi:glutamate-rich protein 3 isoform X2 [Paramisgurnus dabryanus]|uniref:glutamate-rich protein 3 isoform X2 n=1 Tax=Paramisgurnus dabryanus TaxID=90735 RepID=UPI0031F39DF0
MSHFNPGLIAAYNSLTDKHLSGYFNNARIRRHLQKVGLISRSGRIVPDKEYKHKLIQRAHQRHVRECLAQAIFHKRLHQSEIKRKLEEFARREQIHKIKAERSKRCDEEPMLLFSPRPPTGPKISHTRHSGPDAENSESTESPSSSRPNTAPGKMQRPVRLKPLNSNSATTSLRRTSPRYRRRDRESSNDTDQPLSYMLDRDTMRHTTVTDFSSTVSPYRLPVINNYVTPVPPLTKKKDRGVRLNGTHRGRKLRPTTAPTEQPSPLQRTSAQSRVSVRMVYFGKSVHLSHDLMDLTDEVKVFQQHCGGENLCIFKGKLNEGEIFEFLSRRHQGFPFSLTFFLNGLQVERLSSCCEFKHRKGARLGGRHGHFGFSSVEGASPCYKCIIAMGLDKKPTPPPKKVKEEVPSSKSPDAKESTDVDEDIETRSNSEPHASQGMETDHNGETPEGKKPKDDYEEDFEADDEGQVEDEEEVEGKSSSVANNEENDRNENKRDSDSEVEDAMMSNKRSPSVSSGRTSSLSSRDSDNSDREIEEDTKEATADVLEESIHVQPEEDLTTVKMEERSSVTQPQDAEQDSETQDNQVDSVEKSELETSENTEKNEHTKGEKAREESDPDDNPPEPESETATSMQEKLAAAILKESHCSSEPELSDTSTEEDEGASVKTQQDSQGAEIESAISMVSPQPSNIQQDISEENEANTQEAACEKTSLGDDETGQPAEEANTEIPYAHKEEGGEQPRTNEEMTASLEVEECEKTNEDKVQDEANDEHVDVNKESKEEEEEEEMFESVQESETHDQTLDTGNTVDEDIQVIENEFSETAEVPSIEKEGSVSSHIDNDIGTGVANTEGKADADDADQNIERSNDRDERDDQTDEAGDDRSTGEKVQDTGGLMEDGSSGKQEDEGTKEDVKDDAQKEEEDDVVEKVVEKLESENDRGVEDAETPIDGEKEYKIGERSEDQEKQETIEREDEEVLEESDEAEHQENEGGQDLKTDDVEKEEDDGQKEAEGGEQGGNELSGEEGNKNSDDEIVGETEKVNDEMMENRGEEEEKMRDEIVGETENVNDEMMENKEEEEMIDEIVGETEKVNDEMLENKEEEEMIDEIVGETEKVNDEMMESREEEKMRDEIVAQESESIENKAEETLETEEKLVEELKCDEDEAKKKVEDMNETGENVEKEAVSDEKPEENFTEDGNEELVLQEGQIGPSGEPKDDTGSSIKEEVPAYMNHDLLANNIDAENGEREIATQDYDEKLEKDLQEEETPNKLEVETTAGEAQDVTDDSETKPETDEDDSKEQEIENTNLNETNSDDEVASGRGSQLDHEKAVAEEADKDSETSAKTFIENVTHESCDIQETDKKDEEREIITSEEPNNIDTRDAPEGQDSEPEEMKEKSVNEEDGGSSTVLAFKKEEKDLSIDPEDPTVRPAVLDGANGVDLVSNWINIHQTSRYFQTFIEPLDEIKENSDETGDELVDATETQSTDFGGLDETPVDESLITEIKPEVVEDDVYNDQVKDKDEEVKDGDNRGSLVTTWSRQSNEDDINQNQMARQDDHMLNNDLNLATAAGTTSEEIQGINSFKTQEHPSSNPSSQEESKQNNQQTTTEEMSSVSQTEETTDKEIMESSEHNLQSEQVPQTEYIESQSPTITLMTDLTVINRSENGSRDDTASVDFNESRQSDGSKNADGNRRHFKQTPGIDTLSTFSIDDSRFFGPAGYPRLTTAHTENSY